jgi:hypothetical protein
MPTPDKTEVTPTKVKKDDRVLLEISADSVVDVFGNDSFMHERGEQKWYTPTEAAALLAVAYGGRVVFCRVSV